MQCLKQLLLLSTLLVLLVRDPARIALVYVSWRGGPTLHNLVYQLLPLQTAFRGVIVTYLVDALLIPVEGAHPLIPPRHILRGALALHVMRNPQLVLKVQGKLSNLLLGVEAAIGLGDVGVAPRPIIVIVDHFALVGRIDVLPAARLILAHIHCDAAAVLPTRRIVRAGKAAVVARDVHVAARPIDLVHGLESIIAFGDRCG